MNDDIDGINEKKNVSGFSQTVVDNVLCYSQFPLIRRNLLGFENYGNTCFLNAAIQSLLSVISFRAIISISCASHVCCNYV
jgi:ubiquitin C-terminal hydrolase